MPCGWFGCFREEENLLSLPTVKPFSVSVPTVLSRLVMIQGCEFRRWPPDSLFSVSVIYLLSSCGLPRGGGYITWVLGGSLAALCHERASTLRNIVRAGRIISYSRRTVLHGVDLVQGWVLILAVQS
jgi:hypothetical protein